MLGAIEARQEALDALRDIVSDSYRIEHGTRTAANSHEVPLRLMMIQRCITG